MDECFKALNTRGGKGKLGGIGERGPLASIPHWAAG